MSAAATSRIGDRAIHGLPLTDRKPRRRVRTRTGSLQTGRLAAAAAVAVMTGFAAAQPDPPLADASAIGTSDLRVAVRPSLDVVLHAPIEGRIASVPVGDAQTVRDGDLLLQIDDRVQALRTAVARERAAATGRVSELQILHALEADKLERLTASFDSGAAQTWELAEAEARTAGAAARLQAAEEEQSQLAAQLALEEELLRRFRVEAPFDGQLVTVDIDPGENIARDTPLLRIVRIDPLEAVAYLPSSAWGRVAPGATVSMQPPASLGLAAVPATVTAIDPVLDPGSDSFRVVFAIANPDGTLPAGITLMLAGTEVRRLTAAE